MLLNLSDLLEIIKEKNDCMNCTHICFFTALDQDLMLVEED